MTRRSAAAFVVFVAGTALAASSVLVARQTAPRPSVPGFPTEARVVVGNSQADPVPVVLAIPGQLQPVTVVGTPVVSLASGEPVMTRAASQRWEYRSIRVAAIDDPAVALAAAGQEGWEAVSAIPTGDGAQRVLLKRPN